MHERMRHIAIGGIATTVGGALFAFLVWKTGVRSIFEQIQAFGLLAFCGFVAISLMNFALYTWRWKIILEEIAQKNNVRFARLFLHRMSGFATGYLTPGAQVAGEPVRVALLATEGISAKTATSSVVLDLAFEISAFVFYVTLGVVLAVSTGVGAGVLGVVAYAFLAFLVVCMTLFFTSVVRGWKIFRKILSYPLATRYKHVYVTGEWLAEVEEMMTKFFQGQIRMLLGVVALSCVMTGFRAVEVGFIAWGFGQIISPASAILLSTIPGLVLLAPVPGGLGLFEASTAAVLTSLAIPTPAIAFTLIIRLRDFLFILVGVYNGIQEGVGWIGRRKKDPLVG